MLRSLVGSEMCIRDRNKTNKMLENIRIPIEFNSFPDTQWAPRNVDPYARHNRNYFSLKVKPFIPIKLNNTWTLLNYTVLNFISRPWSEPVISMSPAGVPFLSGWNPTTRTGLSSISPTFVLSPNTGPNLVLGIGSSLSAPIGKYPLSTEQWSIGPALFTAFQQDRWVVAARVHNMWSFAGNQEQSSLNLLIVRPRVQYALNKNWFLVSSPLITNDWTKPIGKGWLFPLGGGIGRRFRMGLTRINASIQAYYNAKRPSTMEEQLLGEWNIRTEFNILIPR